jgi:hypothetical protein
MPNPALKKWNDHLAKYRKAHPNMSLKQAMIKAKKTYRKQKGGFDIQKYNTEHEIANQKRLAESRQRQAVELKAQNDSVNRIKNAVLNMAKQNK